LVLIWYLADAVMHGSGLCVDTALASVLSEGTHFFGDGSHYGDGFGEVDGSGIVQAGVYYSPRSGECHGYGLGYDSGKSFSFTF
jgi:hypothetical protein